MEKIAEPRAGLLKTGDVAPRLGASVETVRVLVKMGQLTPIRFGPHGHLRFEAEHVEPLVEANRRSAAA